MAKLLHVRIWNSETMRYGQAHCLCDAYFENAKTEAQKSGLKLCVVKEPNIHSTNGYIHDQNQYRCKHCGKTNAELKQMEQKQCLKKSQINPQKNS